MRNTQVFRSSLVVVFHCHGLGSTNIEEVLSASLVAWVKTGLRELRHVHVSSTAELCVLRDLCDTYLSKANELASATIWRAFDMVVRGKNSFPRCGTRVGLYRSTMQFLSSATVYFYYTLGDRFSLSLSLSGNPVKYVYP